MTAKDLRAGDVVTLWEKGTTRTVTSVRVRGDNKAWITYQDTYHGQWLGRLTPCFIEIHRPQEDGSLVQIYPEVE